MKISSNFAANRDICCIFVIGLTNYFTLKSDKGEGSKFR